MFFTLTGWLILTLTGWWIKSCWADPKEMIFFIYLFFFLRLLQTSIIRFFGGDGEGGRGLPTCSLFLFIFYVSLARQTIIVTNATIEFG